MSDRKLTDAGRDFPKLARLEAEARAKAALSVAVAYPCSSDSLAAAVAARDAGMIAPVLVGPTVRMHALADTLAIDLRGIEIVDTPDDPVAASRVAVALATSGAVKALMKGSQHTDELLGAVVAREANLRTGRRISHVFWFDLPAFHKPLMMTDCVLNIAPSLADKADIVRNAIGFAHTLGIASPKIALLSAVETINPALQSSVDAAHLCEMAARGEIAGEAEIGGPLAFDIALSSAAAATKGIVSSVAGDPDILVVHNLDVGNTLYKSFVYAGRAECAGLVLGARVPVILTSRADSRRARIASCALAQIFAAA